MKKNKATNVINEVKGNTKALKKCGRRKKALIVIATLAGTYIACYIVKHVKRKKARELSERIRFGNHNKDVKWFDNKDEAPKTHVKFDVIRKDYLSVYENGLDDGFNAGYERGHEVGDYYGYRAGKEKGYDRGFKVGCQKGYELALKHEDDFEIDDIEPEFDEEEMEDVANEDNK